MDIYGMGTLTKLALAFVLLVGPIAPIMAGGYVNNVSQNYLNNIKREQIIIQEKVYDFGQNLRIVGIPVTETYPEYYYQSVNRQTNCPPISEKDLERIAELVAQKLGGKMGITPNNPELSEIEKSIFTLVNSACGGCHGENQHKGDLSFIEGGQLKLKDWKGKLTQAEIASAMSNAVLDGSMPQGGEPLSDAQVLEFEKLSKFYLKKARQ